ncbi:DUF6082 family protein [Herbidospora mongoliensis]|uniref:DUF6082 family protein n=1 Tax=Herbidospora mongoliensis TaxID=688067 RepID=UPI0012F8F6F2|nr:DUF6082 family protein [Herbidospora mongoliensis]
MLVLISPAALSILSDAFKLNWRSLADIGQTYGAISAVVSAVALAGVAVSLILQGRALLIAREQTARTFHNELLKLSMDDEVLIRCWGTHPDSPLYFHKQHIYINIIFSHWEALFEIGMLDEMGLRHGLARELFPAEAPRTFWEEHGSDRIRSRRKMSKRRKRVVEIVDEEYRKAIASGPPLVAALPNQESAKQNRISSRQVANATILGVVLVAGAVGGLKILRKLLSLFGSSHFR